MGHKLCPLFCPNYAHYGLLWALTGRIHQGISVRLELNTTRVLDG